jgi:hypothetical protein
VPGTGVQRVMRRARRPAVPLLVALAVGVLLTGCGQRTSGASDPGPDADRDSAHSPAAPAGPAALADVPELDPGVVGFDQRLFHFLADDDSVIGRPAWTACLSNGCWDGAPELGGTVPSVGSPDALWLAFAYPGWDFEHVSFHPVDRKCDGRVIEVAAEKVGDRLFRIDPAGLAGEWRVDVFGYGREGGDAVASVRWTTTTDGALPEPKGTGALFFDQDGERIAYGGPELGLRDLARTPLTATGTWTVTDEAGHEVTVPLTMGENDCAYAGSVALSGPELTADQMASLEGRSMTYAVDLRLDGTTYRGSADWTQRPSRPREPELAFTFDPPLPAYTG